MENPLDFTLYNIVTSQLPEPPDLSVIQEKSPLPETWPVMVRQIVNFRKQLQYFIVSDGTKEVLCFTKVPEIEEKVASLEIGSIIHLIGAETRFSDKEKRYVVDFEEICTLKEYDNRMKEQVEIENNRLVWLKEQGYIEDTDYSAVTGVSEETN